MKVFKGLISTFIFLTSAGCSHIGPFSSPSEQYRAFLEARVSRDELFDRGRSILKVKAMLADGELLKAQEAFTPGHSLEVKKDSTQVLLGVEMASRETFSPKDFQFVINGVSPHHVHEISNLTEIEQHYPFAWPYMRLFVLEFAQADLKLAGSNQLKIQSPVGVLETNVRAF